MLCLPLLLGLLGACSDPAPSPTAQKDAPAAAKPEASPAPPEPADSPAVEPALAEPAIDPALLQPIRAVNSAVTTRGLPQHLRVAFQAPADAPMSLTLEGVRLRDPEGGEAKALTVDQIQLWRSDADAPAAAKLGEAVELPAKINGELLVYLEAWDGDHLAERYDFEVSVARDGGEAEPLTVTVTRATRDPRRR